MIGEVLGGQRRLINFPSHLFSDKKQIYKPTLLHIQQERRFPEVDPPDARWTGALFFPSFPGQVVSGRAVPVLCEAGCSRDLHTDRERRGGARPFPRGHDPWETDTAVLRFWSWRGCLRRPTAPTKAGVCVPSHNRYGTTSLGIIQNKLLMSGFPCFQICRLPGKDCCSLF